MQGKAQIEIVLTLLQLLLEVVEDADVVVGKARPAIFAAKQFFNGASLHHENALLGMVNHNRLVRVTQVQRRELTVAANRPVGID